MIDLTSNLGVCLFDWRHCKKNPKIIASAFHICDFTADTKNPIKTKIAEFEAIIFIGSYQGEVIRWLVSKEGAIPFSTSYGHYYNTKIVQFEECTFPLVRNAIISLSYDGSICVWSVLDGICLRHFPQILPKGCQRIASSPTQIELAAVSGSFSNIYIVDIQNGEIIQQIRPLPEFAVCLKFFSEGGSEWLFALGESGIASYTTLTPKSSKSHRFGLLPIEDAESIIGAFPSPHFYFLILIKPKGYSIVAMFNKEFPCYTDNNYLNIQTAVWTSDFSFFLVKYDGSFQLFNLEKLDENLNISPSNVIQTIGHTTNISIHSPLEVKNKDEVLEQKIFTSFLINPFINVSYTKEKLDQISLKELEDHQSDLEKDLEKVDEIEGKKKDENEGKSEGKKKGENEGKTEGKKKGEKKGENESKSESKIEDQSSPESEKAAKTKFKMTAKKQKREGYKISRSKSDTSSQDSVSPRESEVFETVNGYKEVKYSVNPRPIMTGQTNVPLPLVSTFNGDIAFAFDDYIILAKKGYNEYSISYDDSKLEEAVDENPKAGSRKHKVFQNTTAQAYLIKDGVILALIEGNVDGDVLITYLNGHREQLERYRTGRIVGLCTANDFLFISSEDCNLTVYSFSKKRKIKSYSQFVSPVTKFYFPGTKTGTSIDNCVLFATDDGTISVIDVSNEITESIFMLTSHESQIEKIYFHPPTKLLLIQCRSLYFWSMITGNLESIMNGHQMFKYLHELKDCLVEFNDEKAQDCTPKPFITRYGNFHMRATEINIADFAAKVGASLESHKKDGLNDSLRSIYNDLPFVMSLLSSKSSNVIKKGLENDSLRKKIHKLMRIGFSGNDSVFTIDLSDSKNSKEFYSPQANSLYLSIRIALGLALKHHQFFNQQVGWKKSLKSKNKKLFKTIDLAYLIKLSLNFDTQAQNDIYKMISKESPEDRELWRRKLSLIKKKKLFPNYQFFFDLLLLIIKSTLTNEKEQIEDEKLRSEIGYMSCFPLFVKRNFLKEQNECLKVIVNLAQVLRYGKSCDFTNNCMISLCNSVSYFSNIKEMLPKVSSILDTLSSLLQFFCFATGKDTSFITFGTSKGQLYVYKLKRINKYFPRQKEFDDIFEMEAGELSSSPSSTGLTSFPSSKSYAAMNQRVELAPPLTASMSTSSPFSRSKSFANNPVNVNDNTNKNQNLMSGNETSSSNAGCQSSNSISSFDFVFVGSIDLGANCQIHSVTADPDSNLVFAAAKNNVYKIAVSAVNPNVGAANSVDEALRPELKLSKIDQKNIGQLGIFAWKSEKLFFLIQNSKNYVINLDSEKLEMNIV